MNTLPAKDHSICLFLLIAALSWLLVSCQGNTPEDYAKRFCACHAPESEAAQQLNAGQMSPTDYEVYLQECMGEDDPMKDLEGEEEKAFKVGFFKGLDKHCPELARKLDY